MCNGVKMSRLEHDICPDVTQQLYVNGNFPRNPTVPIYKLKTFFIYILCTFYKVGMEETQTRILNKAFWHYCLTTMESSLFWVFI